MGKKIIFSDVHIYNYSNYNITNRYRLYQNRKVAELLARAGLENGCDGFFIAGDLIEKPTLVSRIQSETKKFMNYLCNVFPGNNYYCLGQHDMDIKDNNQEEEDSILPLISPLNLHYSDKKIYNIDGRLVAFMNWRPDQDLSWIPQKVDLFIGHATIALPNSMYKGQDIDNSKFDLGIFGDIHKHFSFDNIVMCGTPVQNKISDQIESTAIIWNPEDNSWKVVNIDPENELLKIKYTSDKSSEGFLDNYYYVYKPSSKTTDSGEVINIPQWEEINDLVEKIILENDLSSIHSKVLSECKYTEDVDFDFQITKLRLKDFRSIDSLELNFSKGDKIRVSGGNGNGKSSLILGLKYALIENRSLKDYVRFDQPSCECEVEFIYQGVTNKILRGTKTWGLWVNGEKMPYNNKREFEDDCHKRFPFIDYMDVYFFTSGQSSILGSMAPERKSEIISKLFKLDKIDSYNSTASLMYDRVKSLMNSTQDRIGKLKEVVSYLHSKIDNIDLPQDTLEYMLDKKRELTNIKESYERYLISRNEISRLEGTIESLESSIISINESISDINSDELNSNKEDLLYELNNLNFQININNRNKINLNNINKDIQIINSKGSDIFNKINSLSTNKCPTCGSDMNLDKVNKLKESLNNEMSKLLSERENLIRSSESIIVLSEDDERKISDRITYTNNLLEDIKTNIARYESGVNNIKMMEKNKNSMMSQLNVLVNATNSEVTELPEGLNEELEYLVNGISIWNTYNQNYEDLQSKESQLNEYIEEFKDLSKDNEKYERYIKLTGSTGDIYKEIMTRLSKEFSDDVIRYEVNQYKFRNKDHLDLDIQYKVKGRWVGYSSLSSGQQTMADFNFLSRICTGLGILVCDETLKHLSEESTEYVLGLISEMNVNNIILSSHMINVNFHNREVELELDESGITKII